MYIDLALHYYPTPAGVFSQQAPGEYIGIMFIDKVGTQTLCLLRGPERLSLLWTKPESHLILIQS